MQPVEYLIWPIDDSAETMLGQLEHPEYVAEKIAPLKPGSRRLREVLATRCALKHLLGFEPVITYDPHGAPMMTDGRHQLSISHTEGYVAVRVSQQAPVGIDIERRGRRVQRVASHFVHPDEHDLLCLLSPDEETYQLVLHLTWSAKEAAFKVLGPDYYDLQHLTQVIRLDWAERTLLLHVERRPEPMQMHFDYTDEYVVVWT